MPNAHTRREQAKLNAKLPAWAHPLSTRVKSCLLYEKQYGPLRELTPEAVKEIGWAGWMRAPNMGKKSVGELLDLVGRLVATTMWPSRFWP